MRLRDLVSKMRDVEPMGREDPEILGLTADSREVGRGFLFAALPGNRDDGGRHIPEAVRRGAAALLVSRSAAVDSGIPRLVARDVKKALGEAADAFYGHPSRSLALAGITGTNGKTTTAYLLRHIFNRAGRRAGMLGTIEYDLGDAVEPAPLTTPDTVRFTASLAAMRDAGCGAAIVEVSSHALTQERVWPHRFAGAVFTNLTRDHLDYHGDMTAYREAKRRLFLNLDAEAVAVFNSRDPAAIAMGEGIAAVRKGFLLLDDPEPEGLPADLLRARVTGGSLDGQECVIQGYGLDGTLHTPLVGRHNMENCLGAFLLAVSLGVERGTAAAALADFPGVPGRLERLESPTGARIFVDYAHTDDALRSVLSVLRPLVRGKLVTVFGCGGDRDPGKRPLMARAAEEYSDRVVVTSDNPRTENPDAIIDAVMSGFVRPGAAIREADRSVAVGLAVAMAGSDDAVLIAGKGHENYQIIGTEKRHMDDRELVRNAL